MHDWSVSYFPSWSEALKSSHISALLTDIEEKLNPKPSNVILKSLRDMNYSSFYHFWTMRTKILTWNALFRTFIYRGVNVSTNVFVKVIESKNIQTTHTEKSLRHQLLHFFVNFGPLKLENGGTTLQMINHPNLHILAFIEILTKKLCPKALRKKTLIEIFAKPHIQGQLSSQSEMKRSNHVKSLTHVIKMWFYIISTIASLKNRHNLVWIISQLLALELKSSPVVHACLNSYQSRLLQLSRQ